MLIRLLEQIITRGKKKNNIHILL